MATRTVNREERTLRNMSVRCWQACFRSFPASGQIVIGIWGRGLVFLGSIATLIGLIVWRVSVIAYRQTTWAERIPVAFRRQPILYVLVVGVIALWALVVLDAVNTARQKSGRLPLTYVILGVMFFMLGWQIVEIDLVKLFTELSDAFPIITKIAWPWPAAFIRDEEITQGVDVLYTRLRGQNTSRSTPGGGRSAHHLEVTPRCGELSGYEFEGTKITVVGHGFHPGQEVVMWWEDPIGKAFRVRYKGEFITAIPDADGTFSVEFPMPNLFIPPSAGEGPQEHKLQARQTDTVGGLKPSKELFLAIEKMVETIFLGMMATLFGIVLAIPVSFLAAHNLMSGSPLTLGHLLHHALLPQHHPLHRTHHLGHHRHTVGRPGAVRGRHRADRAQHRGAGQALLRGHREHRSRPHRGRPRHRRELDSDHRLRRHPAGDPAVRLVHHLPLGHQVRMSTIIGAVGGGGIGFLLMQWIRLTDYRSAGIAVWFIAITVAILDFVSAKIRERYV